MGKFQVCWRSILKTHHFYKINKILIIVKPPNLAQNHVELFLIKIQNSKCGLSIRTLGIIETFLKPVAQKRLYSGFTTAKTAFISIAKHPVHLNFTLIKIFICSSFIFHVMSMKFWLKTTNNIYKNW